MTHPTALQTIANLDLPLVLFPHDSLAVQQFSDKLANKITSDFLVQHGESLLNPDQEHQLSLLTNNEAKIEMIFQIIKSQDPLLEATFINQVLETKAQMISHILGLSDKDKFPITQTDLVSQIQSKIKDMSSNQIFDLIS